MIEEVIIYEEFKKGQVSVSVQDTGDQSRPEIFRREEVITG